MTDPPVRTATRARARNSRATQDDARGTQALILSAALRTFAERGFDAATTREIATRAGVNHGLIPYYFGDKRKLWRASVDLAFTELGSELDGVLHDEAITDDRARARVLIRGFVRFVAAHPEFVLLMHEEGKRKGERMRWLVDRHVKPLFDAVTALLARASVRGLLPADIAPVHFHYILVGAIGLFFHQAEECKRLSGVDPFEEAAIAAHARAVEFLLLGPEPEATSASTRLTPPSLPAERKAAMEENR